MKYLRGGFLSKHLVVVAVVFVKSAACIRGWVYWLWNEHLRGFITDGGFYLRVSSDRGIEEIWQLSSFLAKQITKLSALTNRPKFW